MRGVEYELQVEEPPSYRGTYRRIALITCVVVVACVIVVILAVTVPNSNKDVSNDIPFAYQDQSDAHDYGSDAIVPHNSSLNAVEVPCTFKGSPSGCSQRFVACGASSKDGIKDTILPDKGTYCKDKRIYLFEWCIYNKLFFKYKYNFCSICSNLF